MRQTQFAIVLALTLLAPTLGRAATPVLRADCLHYSIPSQQPFDGYIQTAPTYLLVKYERHQGAVTCDMPGFGQQKVPGQMTEQVYTVEEVDGFVKQLNREMTELKTTLPKVLKDSVFDAAVKEDQIALIEDELWKRMRLKYGREIDTLNTTITALQKKADELAATTQDLQAKIQTLQTTQPAATGGVQP